MRVLFLGTPDFAVPCLDALLGGPDDVVAVVSQPDRPQGRGLKPEPPPVALRAREAGIPLLQPERLTGVEVLGRITDLRIDLGVTCAFGKILRPAFLETAGRGFLNVHASLLPRHRGASPISRAILEGDLCTGVTIFRLDAGMDTGPILLQRPERILPDDTAGSLSARLARLGASVLREACDLLREGEGPFFPQAPEGATYAPLLRKEDGIISWGRPADQCERFVRAMDPWPGATARWRGQPLRILRVEIMDLIPSGRQPGSIEALDPFPIVAALPGRIRLLRVQPAGRREMDADSWARGARLEPGDLLG